MPRQAEHLRPRTATVPIRLEDYLEMCRGDRVVMHDRVTDEWLAWVDARLAREVK